MSDINSILKWSLMGGFVISIMIGVRYSIGNKIRKTWQYGLWIIVILRLGLPVLPSSHISLFNIFQDNQLNQYYEIGGNEKKESLLNIKSTSPFKNSSKTDMNDLGQADFIKTSNDGMSVNKIGYLIWIIGAMGIGSYFIYGYARLRKKLNKLEEVTDLGIIKLIDKTKDKLGIKHKVKVVHGEQAMIFGIITPTIVLPIDESYENIEMIMRHELMHYKYKDNTINYLQLMILTIHWFNPLVWVGMYLMKQDMEFACDERVLAIGINKKQYATTLFNNTVAPCKKLYLVHNMGENKKQTKKRIIRIANFKKTKVWGSILGGGIIILIAVLCLTNPLNKQNKDNIRQDTYGNSNNSIKAKNKRKKIAIFGLDKDGNHLDTIMVIDLNGQDKVKITSIPRNIPVAVNDKKKLIKENKRDQGEKNAEIYGMMTYGRFDDIRVVLIQEIEKILGEKIDNYVAVDLNTFTKIIDAVGGLELEVPIDMHYEDPYQDLSIDLKQGKQILNGKQVQQLIRFKEGYQEDKYHDTPELQRIERQAEMLWELHRKLSRLDNAQKLIKLSKEIYNDIETDMTEEDMKECFDILRQVPVKYIKFYTITSQSKDKINMSMKGYSTNR